MGVTQELEAMESGNDAGTPKSRGWTPEKADYSILTYRYLRLAIVTVVVTLAVSIILE
jgi:hypothetical protein